MMAVAGGLYDKVTVYILSQEPEGGDLGRAAQEERLTNGQNEGTDQNIVIALIDEPEEQQAQSGEARAHHEGKLEAMLVNKVVGWNVHDGVDQKGANDGRGDICVTEVIDF